MSIGRPLFTSMSGVRYFWKDEGDHKVITALQDTDPILEHNKAAARHNAGWNADKSMRRVGSIPASVRLKWLLEEGWDCLSPDPGCKKKLFEKLDSSDWAHLRSADWRVGILRGEGA